jgi:hypothetical protein
MRDLPAGDGDPSRIGGLESRDQAQGRRLAAARRPQQGDELGLSGLEADLVDGADAAPFLDEIVDCDPGQIFTPRLWRASGEYELLLDLVG